MMLPSRLTLRPERAAAVANSPSTITDTKIAPTTTPGRLRGKMMVRKIRQKLAPRSCAASMMLVSIRPNMKAIGPTMNTQ